MSRVIAITGAARGIGFATAQALKADGSKVAIGDIDEAAAREAGERLGVLALPLDVTGRESFEAFLASVEGRDDRPRPGLADGQPEVRAGHDLP